MLTSKWSIQSTNVSLLNISIYRPEQVINIYSDKCFKIKSFILNNIILFHTHRHFICTGTEHDHQPLAKNQTKKKLRNKISQKSLIKIMLKCVPLSVLVKHPDSVWHLILLKLNFILQHTPPIVVFSESLFERQSCVGADWLNMLHDVLHLNKAVLTVSNQSTAVKFLLQISTKEFKY